MIDIKLLRENPERVREAIDKKKFACDLDTILEFDQLRRDQITEVEQARAQQKSVNQEMACLDKGSEIFKTKIQEMKLLSSRIKTLEKTLNETKEKWTKHILSIPNLPHESVPVGRRESDNQIVRTWGEKTDVSPYTQPHYDIPWFEELIDFPRGVKTTGAGFPFYIGDMARLVRSILQFFLEEACQAGYIEVVPPLFINSNSGTATGQLPDKEGQMYAVVAGESEYLYALPTAEVPITNFFRDEILDPNDLPLRHVAYTPCFRREAGSWGKEVRGLNRLHQFDKVERVQWVHPSTSLDQLERLREGVERLLQRLEIPYRTLLMCSGDIGFPHAKQYDLEVWAGGQKRWLEVSSCSSFTDFQARRANIRFRDSEGKLHFVHTLNGSALAIPRVLAAILENNLEKDGRVRIPEVLQTWYGKAFIGHAVCA